MYERISRRGYSVSCFIMERACLHSMFKLLLRKWICFISRH